MTERKEFKLPDVGEGLTEADIVAWHVKPGDQVEVNQIIVEIETAKAVVELPSPWDGTVATLLADEGQTVDVGVPIIVVDVGDPAGTVPVPPRTPIIPNERWFRPRPPASPNARPSWLATASRPPRRPAARARPRPPQRPAVPAVPAVPRRARRACSARDPRGPGTGQAAGAQAGEGPGHQPGRAWRALGPTARSPGTTCSGQPVVPRLVRQKMGLAGNGSSPATLVAGPRRGGEERIAVKGLRKYMAAAMVTSAFTAPHVTEFLQVDVTETMAAARRVRDLPEYAASGYRRCCSWRGRCSSRCAGTRSSTHPGTTARRRSWSSTT